MAYTKHTWVNKSEPAINADHLNEMEDGIEIGVGKQDKITANGILKGNGSGTISAATAGTDYLTPVNAVTNDATKNYVTAVTQTANGQITVTKGTLPTLPLTYTTNNTTLSIDNSVTNFNLGAKAKPILTNVQYGTTLPSAGTTGQLFFLLEY